MKPYTKHVSYSFEILGEDYSVLHFTDTRICIEEERKNGQEDTHFYGELNLADGRWALDDVSREHLEEYMSGEVADAIDAFFNEHGLPRPVEPVPAALVWVLLFGEGELCSLREVPNLDYARAWVEGYQAADNEWIGAYIWPNDRDKLEPEEQAKVDAEIAKRMAERTPTGALS